MPTLRLGRHGILYVKNKKFRKLTGYEALLLQGFPNTLAKIAKSKINDLGLLKLAGNAMTVTTITEITKKILESIDNPQTNQLWQIYKQEAQCQPPVSCNNKFSSSLTILDTLSYIFSPLFKISFCGGVSTDF